ncbi:hypothetical protein B2K_13870 [Paenibacillus mucilaginosus K02]|uniref:Uncharacterized protein n=1 Tax=Paenibacillus mucilaginosus K02 TaxID=997761 RepID=I0BHE3_9BACL|nr:hypothetical protein B2K_13870 [Paenibacillus mucilaginosus K02]
MSAQYSLLRTTVLLIMIRTGRPHVNNLDIIMYRRQDEHCLEASPKKFRTLAARATIRLCSSKAADRFNGPPLYPRLFLLLPLLKRKKPEEKHSASEGRYALIGRNKPSAEKAAA